MEPRRRVKRLKLGWFRDRLINQENGYVVPDRIDPVALAALQTLAILLERQRLFAEGADQDVEQILGNHDNPIVRLEASEEPSAAEIAESGRSEPGHPRIAGIAHGPASH